MAPQTDRPVRALGLCSGGLDSILSALVLREQGIAVEWITFETPFFSSEKAARASRQTGIVLHVEDITADYLEMLKNPRAGYGKNLNPCMDCHALMFRKANLLRQARDMDFLFSGEVLGQRPMSQNGNSLRYVAKHSGCAELILRPLSAQCLPETQMERDGLVDRARLPGLSGRSRKPQMEMAARFGIKDYPAPAGGCLLTDPNYTRRLRDLFDHDCDLTPQSLNLLKLGRHMRLGPQTRLVVGRSEQENEALLNHIDPRNDLVFKTQNYPGPVAVMPSGGPQPMRFLAASICAGYTKASETALVSVKVTAADQSETISVLPVFPNEAKRFLI